jgi:hypothetical protein
LGKFYFPEVSGFCGTQPQLIGGVLVDSAEDFFPETGTGAIEGVIDVQEEFLYHRQPKVLTNRGGGQILGAEKVVGDLVTRGIHGFFGIELIQDLLRSNKEVIINVPRGDPEVDGKEARDPWGPPAGDA